MSIAPGTHLGPYEVIAPIGSGGMGEVFRARDARLGRDVAIKIVSSPSANDPDRIARFRREAQMLASLNHPHIAAIYGLEEAEGLQFLVMEHVAGETLAARLRRGALPIGEALLVASQLADALEAAHERGIIHRDVKPANIALTPNDQVKVLDFGLAKLADLSPAALDGAGVNLTNSPTMSSPVLLSGAGMLLGTAPYMAPEQVRGKTVDKRCDVWAFGCVLFEMITGRRAFAGDSPTETLGAILHVDPRWSDLPANTPPRVRVILEGCLQKSSDRRLRDLGDVRLALDGAFDGVVASAAPTRPSRSVFAALAGALAVGIGAGSLAMWMSTASPEAPALNRFAITHEAAGFDMRVANYDAFGKYVAVSPDGRTIAYVAFDEKSGTGGGQIYLRLVDELEPRPVSGARSAIDLFFSPDGQWVGFNDVSDSSLKRANIHGGAPVAITRPGSLAGTSSTYGITWGTGDLILLGSELGIRKVPASGGQLETLLPIDSTRHEVVYAFPQLLPDGKGLLFSVGTEAASATPSYLAEFDLGSSSRRKVLDRAGGAEYVSTGHLVYGLEGNVYAVPFDLASRSVRGNSVPIARNVLMPPTFGISQGGSLDRTRFSVSKSTIVYLSGEAPSTDRTLVWIDRRGREEPIAIDTRAYVYARLSPDGKRAALDVRDQENDIWMLEFERSGLTRFTQDPGFNRSPVWSSDGTRLAFSIARETGEEIYWQPVDRSSPPVQLTHDTGYPVSPSGFSPDGKFLLYSRIAGPADVLMVDVANPGPPIALLDSPADEHNAVISPNGRWLAYESNESSRFDIFVRPFPGVRENRWQITTGGGIHPVWARNGRELFFIGVDADGNAALMSAPISDTNGFSAGKPQALARAYFLPIRGTGYDVSPDGQHFLFVKSPQSSNENAARVVVVQNWPHLR